MTICKLKALQRKLHYGQNELVNGYYTEQMCIACTVNNVKYTWQTRNNARRAENVSPHNEETQTNPL